MVHWGQLEILDQLGRVATSVETEKRLENEQLSFKTQVVPKRERKFQAGRHSFRQLNDSNFQRTVLLCPIAKSMVELWREIANEEKSLDALGSSPKEIPSTPKWPEMDNGTKLDENINKISHLKVETCHRRSGSF